MRLPAIWAALAAAIMPLCASARAGKPDAADSSQATQRMIDAAPPAPMFKDVPKDHWAYQAVYDLERLGILVGYPGTAGHSAARLLGAPPPGETAADRMIRSAPVAPRFRDMEEEEFGTKYSPRRAVFALERIGI